MLGFRILVGCKCVIDYVVKVSVVIFFFILFVIWFVNIFEMKYNFILF